MDLASNTDYLACPYEAHLVSTIVGQALNTLSYQRGWLQTGTRSVYPDNIRNETYLEIEADGTIENVTIEVIKPLLGACDVETCEYNNDCAPGLLCAAATRIELRERGLHPRKANCNRRTSGPPTSDVCYRKSLLDERPIIPDRRGLELYFEEENDYDEGHRELASTCGGKCDPRCKKKKKKGACMFLFCDACEEDRRRTQEKKDDKKKKSSLINAEELASLATSKMREISKSREITRGDERCKLFLETAECYPEEVVDR